MKYPLMPQLLHFLLYFNIFLLNPFYNFGKFKAPSKKDLKTYKIVTQYLEWASEYYQKKQFVKSNQMVNKGLQQLGGKGDKLQQFQLYNFLAANYTRIFKDDSAVYAFEKANQLIRENSQLTKENPLHIASLLGNQCVFYRSKHNYNLAINFALKGLEITREYHLKDYSIIIANHLANVYELMRSYYKADSIYRKIPIKDLTSESEKINIYSSMGWNELNIAKYKEAISSFSKALETYEVLIQKGKMKSNIEDETILCYQLGVSYARINNFTKSNKYLNRSIVIQSGKQKSIYLAKCYEQKAQNVARDGNISEALELLQRGLMAIVFEFEEKDITKNPLLTQTIFGENTLFQLLSYKAQLLYKRYQKKYQKQDLQLAAKTYQLAINLAENYREEINTYEDKLIFTQNNTKVFEEALEVVYEWYVQFPTIQNAGVYMNIVESRKSVVYNDYIKQDQLKIPQKYAPLLQQKTLLIYENALLKQAILQKIGKIDSLKNKLQVNEMILLSVKNKLTNWFSSKKQIQGNAFSVKELLIHIPENTTYINYDLNTGNQLYILLFNRKSIAIKKISLPSSFTGTVNQLLSKLNRNPSLMAYTGSREAKDVYKLLLKPIENLISNSNRLVICRDGILNYIPFEVLEEGKTKDDFLVKTRAVTYTFSAIDYVLKQRQPSNDVPKLLSVMPFLKNCILPNGDTLKALRNTFKKNRTHSAIVGQFATKVHFLKILNQYNQLNLVTHSTTNPQNPADSYLYFYPDSLTRAYQLGFYEILALPLQKQQLVIIASCNSANGTLQEHEGTISLAYAFMRAGAEAVIGASWEAHNRASIIITESFQQYLSEGYSKDVALQKAKIDFINSRRSIDLNHPFYWANLNLIGNNQPLIAKKIFPWVYIFGIVVLLVLVLLIKINLPKKFATIV